MASNKIQEKIKDWLFENGFENGFADTELQKPLFVSALIIAGSLLWANSSSTKIANFKSELLQESDRGKVVASYELMNDERKIFMQKAALPQGADPREWVQSNIAALASEANLEVASSEPGDEKFPTSDLSISYWKYVFRGTYHALGAFVYKVESNQPAIGISDMDFTRSKDFDADIGAPLEIKATLFVIQEKLEAGGLVK